MAALAKSEVYDDLSARERRSDEFVSTVSHELRTPLTAITASLCLLKSGGCGELPPAAARLISIAHSNGERLVRLVNDILDLEKIDSTGHDFRFQAVELRALLEAAIDAARFLGAPSGVELRLVAGVSAVEVRGDPDRLMQIMMNLLSNAVKFSPPHEEIVVGVALSKRGVRIAVRDRGPGIPDDFKPRIFERFAQAPAKDGRKSGTGLGLSIVREIVRRHGGSVGFESVAGHGALFWFELPLLGDVEA